MFTIKQDPDALDLTNHSQHLLSPSIDNEDEEEEEYLPSEDDHQQTNPFILKKATYDSGFVDTSDENHDHAVVVKQERNRHHYHSTPLRPQQIHTHIRHPSTSSSTCSSPTNQERSHSPVDEKECRNTRFLGSRAVAVLNQWFQSNRDYPYPDDERTDRLAREAGITQKQVKKWFANKRVRSQMCYKPLYRSRKSRQTSSLRPVINPLPTVPTATATGANVSSVHSSSSSSSTTTTTTTSQIRRPQTNYNYIINHNNIATPSPSTDFSHVFPTPNPALFNPMAASMMMFMMQQHLMTSMMAAAGLPPPLATSPLPVEAVTPPPPPPSSAAAATTTTTMSNTTTTTASSSPKKPQVDRITRFWL